MTQAKQLSSAENRRPKTPVAMTDAYGIVVPSALPLLDELEVLLMRCLGRLDMMTLTQIHQAIYPSYSVRGVQHRLKYLLDDDLLWRVQTRTVAANHAAEYTKVRKQGAFAYGLSGQGKELLNILEVERDPLTFERLVSRDPRGRKPDLRTLSHDLQVSWWCLNVLLAALRNSYCQKIYIQTEFVSEARQRIDALVILRLCPEHPRKPEAIGPFPFFDGTPRAPGEVDVRLALEVDKGSEELKVLLAKIAAYRDLTLNNTYNENLGGPVLPVFLVQTPRRAAQIATEFRDIWRSGWGVVATPQSANHPTDGVLWGKYKSLGTAESFDLPTNMMTNSSGLMQFFPAISRETWRQGMVAVTPSQLSPEQLAGRKGGQQTQVRRRESKHKKTE